MREYQTTYRRKGKRLLDITIVGLSLFITLPIIVIITLVVGINYAGNPFFTQIRTGQYGRLFRLIKFRTMTNPCDANGNLLADSLRLTLIGRWLRQTSLDELPQLWNIIRGDMSLIGPRPLLPDYWPLYTPDQRRRHNVPAGLTGWAQVNGRNGISWEAKFALDNWYIEHLSLGLDLRILWQTAKIILFKQDNRSRQHTPMPRFTGTITDK